MRAAERGEAPGEHAGGLMDGGTWRSDRRQQRRPRRPQPIAPSECRLFGEFHSIFWKIRCSGVRRLRGSFAPFIVIATSSQAMGGAPVHVDLTPPKLVPLTPERAVGTGEVPP
jgi:hypothetical protein